MAFTQKINSLPLGRRLLAYIGMTFAILIAIYGVVRPIQVWLGSLYTGDRSPYLQMPAPTAMTLRWQTLKADQGLVRYGLNPDQLSQVMQESDIQEDHELRLTGLKPATKYYYAIGNPDSLHYGGPDYWFTTPPPVGTSAMVRFAVLGDPGYPSTNQNTVRAALLNWMQSSPREHSAPIDLLLTTGDNAYRSGTNEQYQLGFFEPYAMIMRNVPVWPIYGNHDARRHAFFDVFSFPTHAESGGVASNTEHYYSFDYGLAHFIVLDSEQSDLSKGAPMLRWLQKDLAASKQPWQIALFHHPPYSRGSHNSDDSSDSKGRMTQVRESVIPILEQGGVDLVITGHSHMYQRSHLLDCHYESSDKLRADSLQMPTQQNGRSVYQKPVGRIAHQGAIYAVVGASSKISGVPNKHPVMAIAAKKLGFLGVEISESKLDASYISNTGLSIDNFTIRKSNSNPVHSHCETGK